MGGGISTATTQIPEDILINLQKASSLIKANTEESLKIILNISRNAENNQYLCLPELGILPLLVNNIKKERNNSNDLYYPLAILSNITNSSHTNNFLLQSVSELGLIQLLLTIIYDGKGDFRLYSCLILLHLSLRVEIISLITNTNRTSIHHSHGSHSSYSPSRSHSNDYSVVNSTNNRANNSNSNSHVSSNQSHETGRNTSQTHSVVTNSNIQILLDVVKNDVGDTRSYCINIFYNIAKHGSHNDNYEVYKNNVHVAVITLLFNNGPNKSAWEHPKSITNSLNFLLYFSVYNFTKISIREEGLLELLVEMYTITNNDNGYRKKALLIMLLLYGMEENSNPVLKPILSHLSDGINYVIILLKDLLDGQLLIENNQEEVITLLLVLKVCYFLSLSDSNKTKLVSSPLVLLLGRILDSYMINDTSILITVTNLNNSHSHSHSHSNSHSHGTPVINGISDISTGITTTFHNNHSDIFSDHGINSNTPESMLTRATEISIEILIQLSFSYEEDYLLQTQLMTPEMGFLELFQGILKKRSLNENTLINTKLMCQRLEPVPSIVISSKNSIHSSINTVSVIRNKIMILTSHSKSSRIDLVNGLSANLKQKKYDVHINQVRLSHPF